MRDGVFTRTRPKGARRSVTFPPRGSPAGLASAARETSSLSSTPRLTDTLVEMGTVKFSTEPIADLGLQALALRSPDAIDVRFERLSIKADKIVRLEQPPSTGWGSGTWLTLAAVLAVFIGGIAAWRLRSGRDAATEAESPASSRRSPPGNDRR